MAEEPRDEPLPVAAPLATIATLNQHEGQAVTLRGWLYNLRASGKLLFPIFRDGTGTVQGIVPKAAVPPEVFERVRGPDPRVKRHRDRQGESGCARTRWL